MILEFLDVGGGKLRYNKCLEMQWEKERERCWLPVPNVPERYGRINNEYRPSL